jgi:hypothetical protein
MFSLLFNLCVDSLKEGTVRCPVISAESRNPPQYPILLILPSTPQKATNRNKMRLISTLLVVLATLVSVVAAQTNKMTAMVRAVHAVYDAPAVDVYVNDAKALSDFAYFSVSAYLSVPAVNGSSNSGTSSVLVKVTDSLCPARSRG